MLQNVAYPFFSFFISIVLDANGNLMSSLDIHYEVDEIGSLNSQYREFINNGNPASESVTYIFED
jgi:hypothetical protein